MRGVWAERPVCARSPACGRRCTRADHRYCSPRCAQLAQRTAPVYYITCANPQCGALKQVRSPFEQRQRRFCSRRCAGLTLPLNLTREGQRRGGAVTASKQRQGLLARLAGKTPLEAFRLGYNAGLKSKHRQIQRKLEEIRAARKAHAA